MFWEEKGAHHLLCLTVKIQKMQAAHSVLNHLSLKMKPMFCRSFLTFNSPFGKSLPSFIPWRLAMNSWQVIFLPMFWKGWQRKTASYSCCFGKLHKKATPD